VRHQNSVFHAITKLIPWGAFERLVDEHDADARVRKLTTKSQFLALLYGQLAGAESLRDIVGAVESHAPRLYHLGATKPSRSTLSDANALRSPDVFTGLFARLIGQALPGLRKHMREPLHLIDSTGFRLSALAGDWAQFSANACGAKLHVVYDPDADCPLYAALSGPKVNDISAAKQMPIDPKATYVFDLGYYDYGWWARLDAAGCRIVTRLKTNTKLSNVVDNAVPAGSNILSDQIGLLPHRLAASRKNPFADPVREVQVRIETGKVLRILSNDLDAPADEIAALYKRRWQIELFFRWIKQTLKVRHFVGRSENAVRIQLAVALIAFVLLRMAHQAQKAVQSPLAFARLVRANLMHRRPIDRLSEPGITPSQSLNQLTLALSPC
jgi:hypothetical protein